MTTWIVSSSAHVRRATLLFLVAGVAACSGSTASNGPSPVGSVAPPAAQSTPAASTTASPFSSTATVDESPAATALVTTIDPCQLITAEEAGTLAKTTFGAGKESTTEGNARICTYGGNTSTVFMVEVAIAPDEATAQSDEAAAKAQIEESASQLAGKGMKVTELPGFAPGADAILMEGTVAIAGHTVGGRAIYVLHGTTFFGFSDLSLDGAPPTADAMKAEAMTLLGRLP